LTPPASPQPTLVVENNKAVAFDFDMTRTVSIPHDGTITLELNINAPIPNPVTPGLGTTTYSGVLDNVTFNATFASQLGKETVTGTTVPTFTVVPEPESLGLLCIGTVIVGLLRVRQRACFSCSNC
jgi:hypothetical protein